MLFIDSSSLKRTVRISVSISISALGIEPALKASRTTSVISLSVSVFHSSRSSTDLNDWIEEVAIETDRVIEAGEVVKGMEACDSQPCPSLGRASRSTSQVYIQSLAAMPWLFKKSAPPSRLALHSVSLFLDVGRGVTSGSNSNDSEKMRFSGHSKGSSSGYGKPKSLLSLDGGTINGTAVSSPLSFESEGFAGEDSRETGEVADVVLLSSVESMS